MCGDKMKTEFECRILDIDVEDFKDRLRKVNAQKITERNMRRFTYDVDPKLNSWIRVRDDGERTTITYKRIHTDTIDGTKELEFGVDAICCDRRAPCISHCQRERREEQK